MQALMVGIAAGLASDALGAGGLLGAGGFSKTLTAYLVVSLATRVMIDNPLARIPVLAGAALFDDVVYVLLHRILGQTMNYRFVDRAPFKMIATTVAGTIILYVLDQLFSERARQRRQLAFRRRMARRSPMRLGRKR
jgi:rod shape-determining protein MreD